MKIYESWKRNKPDTVTGESITVTIVYQSFDKDEIDKLQEKMPDGMLVFSTEKQDAQVT